MRRVSTYLNFMRQTEEALALDGKVFGTETSALDSAALRCSAEDRAAIRRVLGAMADIGQRAIDRRIAAEQGQRRPRSAAELAGDHEVLDLVGSLADLKYLRVAVEAGDVALQHVAGAAEDLHRLATPPTSRPGWPSAWPWRPPS